MWRLTGEISFWFCKNGNIAKLLQHQNNRKLFPVKLIEAASVEVEVFLPPKYYKNMLLFFTIKYI